MENGENKTVKRIGGVVSPKQLRITCKGCSSKFRNFFKYCLPTDSMKWDCQNCSSEFVMNCRDSKPEPIQEKIGDQLIDFDVEVTMKKRGWFESKRWGLINNSKFREIIEVKE